MARITLSAYEINVRPLRDTENTLILSDFANGNDLLSFLRDYIGNWQGDSQELIDNEDMQKLLRLSPNTLNPFGRQLSGILESGDYGYQSEIIDRTSGERVHAKDLDHAEMIPFYFHLYIPEGTDKGILLLQRFKQFGIYSIFGDTIVREFRERFPESRFILKPLVSDEVVNDLVRNSSLKKITFKTLGLTPAIMNASENGENNQNVGHIEYSIVANRGCTLPFLQSIRDRMRHSNNIPGLFSLNDEEFNRISISVRLNGHTRTLDLSSLQNVGAYFDITDQVDIDVERGHPNLNSIRTIANDIINDLYVTMYPVNRVN